MAVVISMLRGVNLVRHNRIKMEALRAIYESIGLRDPQTYIQSGNVVFRTSKRDLRALGKSIEQGLEQSAGFRPTVVLRTTAEMREAIARNPFAKRRDINPSNLLVTFLAEEPGAEACEKLRKLDVAPEEVRLSGRELYIYYPNGQANTNVPWTKIEKTLKVAGTGRNWNSVTKLLEMAEALESA
jgi:uncharacterized protein (DUF1697 family)